jgi:uncharacterized protein (DUF488 family)
MMSPTPPTLFTLGYQQRTPDEFVALLRGAGVDVLVDVRETPLSHKPGFSKRGLEQALAAQGIAYVHAGFAGTPKAIRSGLGEPEDILRGFQHHLDTHPEVLDLFDELIGRLLDAGKRVCIACYERDPAGCHRRVLAERWRQGCCREVRHLGAERDRA